MTTRRSPALPRAESFLWFAVHPAPGRAAAGGRRISFPSMRLLPVEHGDRSS